MAARLIIGALSFCVMAAAGANAKTLGFAITDWRPSVYETQYYDECPEGLAIGNDEIWWKGLSPKDRDRLTDGGLIEPVDGPRARVAEKRGPHGEDVCWRSELFNDPPLRTVKGKTSYGMNLDGTDDGHATDTTCQHEKFTSPDGGAHVDNQIYRILGCVYGWRRGQYMVDHANRERRDSSKGIILMEVTGVDDERNDSDVTVAYYGTDTVLSKDSDGKILPYASYKITQSPLYGATVKGRIVDGVLTTDAVDATLPLFGHNVNGDMVIRAMRLRMKLDDVGKNGTRTGLLAGYYDLDSWMRWLRGIEFIMVTGQWDCPAMLKASQELADGYKDPKSGACTALSSSMDFEAQPGFIIHPDKDKTAQATEPNRSVQ